MKPNKSGGETLQGPEIGTAFECLSAAGQRVMRKQLEKMVVTAGSRLWAAHPDLADRVTSGEFASLENAVEVIMHEEGFEDELPMPEEETEVVFGAITQVLNTQGPQGSVASYMKDSARQMSDARNARKNAVQRALREQPEGNPVEPPAMEAA